MDPSTGKSIADSQVTWSPDGSRIAFLSTGRGVNEDACDTWAMNPQDLDGDGFGDKLEQLTSDESVNCSAFEDVTPSWSPDSSLIAFTSVRFGYWDIWLVNADDPSDLRNATATPTEYEDQPSWSPDGTQIIFRKAVDGLYQLFSLPVPPPSPAANRNADASAAPTQLTFGGQSKNEADWGADAGAPPETATLTVTKARHGLVTSDPTGIRCGKRCVADYRVSTVVTLSASPEAGYEFKRWRGGCAGTKVTCSVQMSAATTVSARSVAAG